jgi:hypothetical protein
MIAKITGIAKKSPKLKSTRRKRSRDPVSARPSQGFAADDNPLELATG